MYKRQEQAGPEGSEKREDLFNKLLAAMYESGKALNVAMYHEIDAVIDPRDTRKWIMNGVRAMPPGKKGGKGKRPFIDTW